MEKCDGKIIYKNNSNGYSIISDGNLYDLSLDNIVKLLI